MARLLNDASGYRSRAPTSADLGKQSCARVVRSRGKIVFFICFAWHIFLFTDSLFTRHIVGLCCFYYLYPQIFSSNCFMLNTQFPIMMSVLHMLTISSLWILSVAPHGRGNYDQNNVFKKAENVATIFIRLLYHVQPLTPPHVPSIS